MKGHMDKQTYYKEKQKFDNKIGTIIKNKRLQKGADRGSPVTQSELSEVIACSFQQIQKYEKATNSTATFTFFCIMKSLGLSIPELIKIYLSVPTQEIQGGLPDKILLGQVPTPNNPRRSSEYVDVDAQSKSV